MCTSLPITHNDIASGTAVYLYGSHNCSYTVTLDSSAIDIPSGMPDDMLFLKENLSSGNHFVGITAHPETNSNQQLAFDRAVYTNIVADGR